MNFKLMRSLLKLMIITLAINLLSLLFSTVFLLINNNANYMFLNLAILAPGFQLVFKWIPIIKLIGHEKNPKIMDSIITIVFYKNIVFQYDIMMLLITPIIAGLGIYLMNIGHSNIACLTLLPMCVLPGTFLYITTALKRITLY